MAYRSVHLDLQKKHDLNKPLFVDIVPMVWLPTKVAKMFDKYIKASEAITGDGAEAMDANYANMKNLIPVLSYVIEGWNLEDGLGKPHPLPKAMLDASDEEKDDWIQEIPMQILANITEVMSEQGDIPLVSENTSKGEPTTPSLVSLLGKELPPSEEEPEILTRL